MDWENKGTLIEAGSEPETTEYVQAICDIFDVEKYDESTGEGLTETELAGLLNHLTEWLLGVKKIPMVHRHRRNLRTKFFRSARSAQAML